MPAIAQPGLCRCEGLAGWRGDCLASQGAGRLAGLVRQRLDRQSGAGPGVDGAVPQQGPGCITCCAVTR